MNSTIIVKTYFFLLYCCPGETIKFVEMKSNTIKNKYKKDADIMKTILIIEDDIDLREGISFSLQSEGYQILTAEKLEDGWKSILKENPDLILLDCNLPDGTGFDLCIRVKEHMQVPILMLTARDTEMDEVKALELGMDDFMSKPFSLAVLKARIKKLFLKEEKNVRLSSNGVTIDKNSCKVFRNDQEIVCSKIEYQMLVYFVENKNQVLSKEQILSYVWDSQGKYVDDNTVSVNIRRLRGKIEVDPKNPELIKTVHGMGYIWKEGKR